MSPSIVCTVCAIPAVDMCKKDCWEASEGDANTTAGLAYWRHVCIPANLLPICWLRLRCLGLRVQGIEANLAPKPDTPATCSW